MNRKQKVNLFFILVLFFLPSAPLGEIYFWHHLVPEKSIANVG